MARRWVAALGDGEVARAVAVAGHGHSAAVEKVPVLRITDRPATGCPVEFHYSACFAEAGSCRDARRRQWNFLRRFWRWPMQSLAHWLARRRRSPVQPHADARHPADHRGAGNDCLELVSQCFGNLSAGEPSIHEFPQLRSPWLWPKCLAHVAALNSTHTSSPRHRSAAGAAAIRRRSRSPEG